MYIHIADADENVRMILPPSLFSPFFASEKGWSSSYCLYLYVSGFTQHKGMTFDGTHIHIADDSDDNVRMILPPSRMVKPLLFIPIR